MKIRILLLLFTISCAAFSGCHKNNLDYKSEGTITGPDYRMCPCCGGWFITIDGTEHYFWALPQGNDLNFEKENFPLEVQLDWHTPENPCLENRIEVDRIRKK